MARKMPTQKPGKSEQSVQTPPEFLRSVRCFLGIEEFRIDLAASKQNRVCDAYLSIKQNSLVQPWHRLLDVGGRGHNNPWAWLNPPYSNIEPWVRKAAEEYYMLPNYAGIAMLVPASTNSNWWVKYVDGIADVRFPTGRMTFVGHTSSYPKDLALLLYSLTREPGYHVWNWRAE